jgi:acyl dehydratase
MLYFEDFEVGATERAGDYLLDREELIAFARQWDPQRIHTDAEFARELGLKDVSASSCHTFCINAKLMNQLQPYALVGAMEMDMKMPTPAYGGDRLFFTRTCLDKRVSRSKPGRGIVTFEFRLYNQNDETVLLERPVLMLQRRAAGNERAGA